MITLKEISNMNPNDYKVIDLVVRKGDVKTPSDRIEIIVNHKSRFCTRLNGYKYGLCEI